MSKPFRCPPWLRVKKKPMVKCVISALVFTAFYGVLQRNAAALLDGLFLAGMLMLLIGCWYLVRWLGLFDFTVYSWKRFIRALHRHRDEEMEPMPTYAEYLQQSHPLPSAGDPFLTAVLFTLVYLAITYWPM